MALLTLGGPLAADAHAIGLLFTVDRVRPANALPKQLRFLVVEHFFQVLFGAPRPHIDPDAPAAARAWTDYLTEVARRAGHRPTLLGEADQSTRRALAWAGILEALAERLRRDERGLSPAARSELGPVVRTVAAGLKRESAGRASEPRQGYTKT
jgi:hypothetical protein